MSSWSDHHAYPGCPARQPTAQSPDPVTSVMPMQQAAVTPPTGPGASFGSCPGRRAMLAAADGRRALTVWKRVW